MTKRDVVLRSPPFAVPGFDFQEGGAAGLGRIIELCQDINYNQKQLFCAPKPFLPLSAFPLPSVAPSRPFLILCKLYYFHCLFTSLPILYPSAQDLRRLSGFCRVSPLSQPGTVLKSFPGTPFPPKISPSALYRFAAASRRDRETLRCSYLTIIRSRIL